MPSLPPSSLYFFMIFLTYLSVTFLFFILAFPHCCSDIIPPSVSLFLLFSLLFSFRLSPPALVKSLPFPSFFFTFRLSLNSSNSFFHTLLSILSQFSHSYTRFFSLSFIPFSALSLVPIFLQSSLSFFPSLSSPQTNVTLHIPFLSCSFSLLEFSFYACLNIKKEENKALTFFSPPFTFLLSPCFLYIYF